MQDNKPSSGLLQNDYVDSGLGASLQKKLKKMSENIKARTVAAVDDLGRPIEDEKKEIS